MRTRFSYSIIVLSAFRIGNCTVRPHYTPLSATIKIPKNWHATLPHNSINKQMVNWWGQYNDLTLVYFIESVVKTYPDLAGTVVKIKQKPNLGINDSPLFPNVLAIVSSDLNQKTLRAITSSSLILYYAVWELDLFGKVSRGAEANRAKCEASVAYWNYARISLAAHYLKSPVALAKAQYKEIGADYKGKVINTVKEVEDPLVRIERVRKNANAVKTAFTAYKAYFETIAKTYQSRLTSTSDLEKARINLESLNTKPHSLEPRFRLVFNCTSGRRQLEQTRVKI